MTTETPFDFEAAVQRLHEIISSLDAAGTRLADSVALYEEGIMLLEQCARELHGVQERVMELRKRIDGAFELLPLDE